MTIGAKPSGDNHGLGHNPTHLAHVDVGGIEPDVGEGLVIEASSTQDSYVSIDLSADAGDRRARDALVAAQGLHEVIDFSSRRARDVGSHNPCPKRSIDSTPGF